MLSFQHSTPIALLAIFCALLFVNTPAHASPLYVRQQDGSMTLTTKTTEMTRDGPVTKICTITLTPLPGGNVREVTECKQELDSTATSASPSVTSSLPGSTFSSISTSVPPGSTSTSSSLSITTGSVSSSNLSSSLSLSTSTALSNIVSSTISASSTSTSGPVIVNSVSSVIPATVSTSSSASSTPSIVFPTTSQALPTSQATTVADNTPQTTPSITSAATTNASESAAAAEATQSSFNMPGKTLSVLPIGLGVFAGISVIALIVVGLVTYERTKYRKAFRQRKLAESGATMGYGGMQPR